MIRGWMALTFLVGLLAGYPCSAAAQGWVRGDVSDAFTSEQQLNVMSTERNARLTVACFQNPIVLTEAARAGMLSGPPDQVDRYALREKLLALDLKLLSPSIFDYHGSVIFYVSMKVRLLPDSTLYGTEWYVNPGYEDRASMPEGSWPASPFGSRDITTAEMFAKLSDATTLQVQLQVYGGGAPVATFAIRNKAVLRTFVADCRSARQKK